MKLHVYIVNHWKGDYPLFGIKWNGKHCSPCPYGKDVLGKWEWCKTGFRLMFGHPEKHIDIDWADSLDWCPLEKSVAKKVDCTTCKHGKYNDHYGFPFCYNPNRCENFELYEKK